MLDEELLYFSLQRIASTIERIIDNSKGIDEAIVFDVVKNKLPGMLETIRKMTDRL